MPVPCRNCALIACLNYHRLLDFFGCLLGVAFRAPICCRPRLLLGGSRLGRPIWCLKAFRWGRFQDWTVHCATESNVKL